MTKQRATTLGKVINKIPGNQQIIVKNYLTNSHYATGAASDVISRTLDYNRNLRNADVYGISIEGINIITIDILIDE